MVANLLIESACFYLLMIGLLIWIILSIIAPHELNVLSNQDLLVNLNL